MPFYIIDDVLGDSRPGSQYGPPTFSPPRDALQWDPVGGNCSECTAGADFDPPIDITKVQSGTWHTVTVNPSEVATSVSVTFIGTWLAAYCLLPPDLGSQITTSMDLSFVLDGQNVGPRFQRTITGSGWQYNSTVYNSPPLENKEHTFIIEIGAGIYTSFLAFDYFQYEYDGEPAPVSSAFPATFVPTPSSIIGSRLMSHYTTPMSAPTPTPTPTANVSHPSPGHSVVIGGAVGGAAIALLAVLLLFWCLHRRSQRGDSEQASIYTVTPTPYLLRWPPRLLAGLRIITQDVRQQVRHDVGASSVPEDSLNSAGVARMQAPMQRTAAEAAALRPVQVHPAETSGPDSIRHEIEPIQATIETAMNAPGSPGEEYPPPSYASIRPGN